jgi:hypothetical protein
MMPSVRLSSNKGLTLKIDIIQLTIKASKSQVNTKTNEY